MYRTPPPHEAWDILLSRLTEEDRAKVFTTYKDMNSEIRWGKIAIDLLTFLTDAMEDVVFKVNDYAGESFTKNDPWYLASEDDKELFDHGNKAMHRRQLLMSLLVKKLLGVLKTTNNKVVNDVPVLTFDQEEDLLDVVRNHSKNVKTPDVKTDVPQVLCTDGGERHVRTYCKQQFDKEGAPYMASYCKDCKKLIQKIYYKGRRQSSFKTSSTPIKCFHTTATWVEGKEGHEAACGKCGEVIKDPSVFKWERAGLEPFGDNPHDDEVITLCSDY